MIRATEGSIPLRSVYRSSRWGESYHWFEAGPADGEIIVLVHGFMAHAMTYRRIVDELSADYRLVLPDLPAHGKDRTFGTRALAPTVEALVEWLDDFLSSFEEPVHVVGHSLGATLTYLLAQKDSERFRTMTLVDPGLRIPVSRVSRFVVDKIPTRLARLGANHFGMALYEPIQWFGERMSRWEKESYLAPLRDRTRLSFMLRLGSDMLGRAEEFGELRPADVDTFLMWGEHDHILPVDDAPEIARRLEALDLVVVSGAGHSPMEDRPGEFTRLYRRVLRLGS